MERKTHIYSNFSFCSEHRLLNERTMHPEDAPAPDKKNEKKEESERPKITPNIPTQVGSRVEKAEKDAPILKEAIAENFDMALSMVVEELNKDKPNAQIVYKLLSEINIHVASIVDKNKKLGAIKLLDSLNGRLESVNENINEHDYHLALDGNTQIIIDPEFVKEPGYDGEFERVLAPLELKVDAWDQIYKAREIVKSGDIEKAKTLLVEMKKMEEQVLGLNVDIAVDSAFQKAINALEEAVAKKEKQAKKNGEIRVTPSKRRRGRNRKNSNKGKGNRSGKRGKKEGFKYGEIINNINEKSKEYSEEAIKKGSKFWENLKSGAKTAGESARKFVDGMNIHKAETIPTPDLTSIAPESKPTPPEPTPEVDPAQPKKPVELKPSLETTSPTPKTSTEDTVPYPPKPEPIKESSPEKVGNPKPLIDLSKELSKYDIHVDFEDIDNKMIPNTYKMYVVSGKSGPREYIANVSIHADETQIEKIRNVSNVNIDRGDIYFSSNSNIVDEIKKFIDRWYPERKKEYKSTY